MDQATNIVNTLVKHGIVIDREAAQAIVERLTNPDFIPGGMPVRKVSNVRPNLGGYRCCFQTCEDVQSGPIYCGEAATLVADSERKGYIIAACSRHEDDLKAMQDQP